jgi:hypothetical protein
MHISQCQYTCPGTGYLLSPLFYPKVKRKTIVEVAIFRLVRSVCSHLVILGCSIRVTDKYKEALGIRPPNTGYKLVDLHFCLSVSFYLFLRYSSKLCQIF